VTPFLIAGLGAYVALEDRIVREQFEGKRWALPARVYAGPVELFVGAAYDASGFEWFLHQLKYRKDPQLSTQGTFVTLGEEMVFKTREFQFPDKTEPARELRIQFADGQVILLEDMTSGQAVDLLRLEPPQIGSFYPARREDRVLIRLDQAPDTLLKALFASEDHNFYAHHGVSLRGMIRAVFVNLRAGGIVQGGSTLTQQLVKNFFLSSERTWWRKINEIVMAMILDARYTKEEILEAYLNEIYLGQDGSRAIHGFGLASQYYFGRSIEELELHHIAVLVALVRGPSYYDPYTAPDRTLKRRDLILDEMRDQGFIDAARVEEAKKYPLDVVKDPHQSVSRYPAFMDLVKRQLEKNIGRRISLRKGCGSLRPWMSVFSIACKSQSMQIFPRWTSVQESRHWKSPASLLARAPQKLRHWWGDARKTAWDSIVPSMQPDKSAPSTSPWSI